MLNIKAMSIKALYKHLLEVLVTHTEPDDPSALPCRVERLAPSIDWGKNLFWDEFFSRAKFLGLTSQDVKRMECDQ